MARAGGSRGGATGGGSRGFGNSAGRSFGGRSGGSSSGGSFRRGGVTGGNTGGRPSSSPRPRTGGGFGTPGGLGGLGGFGGYGGYGGGYNYGRGYGPGVPPPPPPRRRRGWYGGGPGYYGGGCFTMVLVVVLVMAFSAVLVFGAPTGGTAGLNSNNSIAKSTVEREKLPNGSVNETGYYTDELGWISNSSLLLGGMEYFYQKTGVQPYLYLSDNIYGNTSPSGADAERFANELYEELFTDEAHFLLIFIEYNDQYNMWYLGGNQAKSVMDTEASGILLDYVQKYYYDSSLSDEQCFSKAFHDTADRIMAVTRSPWIPVLIVLGVIAVLAILFLWWRNARRQRELEDHRTAQILNTPLETYGDTQVEELEEKYRSK